MIIDLGYIFLNYYTIEISSSWSNLDCKQLLFLPYSEGVKHDPCLQSPRALHSLRACVGLFPFSLTVSTLAPDHLFEYWPRFSRSQKIQLFCFKSNCQIEAHCDVVGFYQTGLLMAWPQIVSHLQRLVQWSIRRVHGKITSQKAGWTTQHREVKRNLS